MPDAPPRPEPFAPQPAPAALEDLRARLRATRWPDAPEEAGWSLGTDLAYLRELVAYQKVGDSSSSVPSARDYVSLETLIRVAQRRLSI